MAVCLQFPQSPNSSPQKMRSSSTGKYQEMPGHVQRYSRCASKTGVREGVSKKNRYVISGAGAGQNTDSQVATIACSDATELDGSVHVETEISNVYVSDLLVRVRRGIVQSQRAKLDPSQQPAYCAYHSINQIHPQVD